MLRGYRPAGGLGVVHSFGDAKGLFKRFERHRVIRDDMATQIVLPGAVPHQVWSTLHKD